MAVCGRPALPGDAGAALLLHRRPHPRLRPRLPPVPCRATLPSLARPGGRPSPGTLPRPRGRGRVSAKTGVGPGRVAAGVGNRERAPRRRLAGSVSPPESPLVRPSRAGGLRGASRPCRRQGPTKAASAGGPGWSWPMARQAGPAARASESTAGPLGRGRPAALLQLARRVAGAAVTVCARSGMGAAARLSMGEL